MLKDKGLLILFTIISMAFGFAILISGNDYWWVFWFSMLFFYGHLVNVLLKIVDDKEWGKTVKKNSKTWPNDFIDDGGSYKDYLKIKDELAKDKNNYCKECGYLICVCKPVVN